MSRCRCCELCRMMDNKRFPIYTYRWFAALVQLECISRPRLSRKARSVRRGSKSRRFKDLYPNACTVTLTLNLQPHSNSIVLLSFYTKIHTP